MIKCISYWSMPRGGKCPLSEALERASAAGFEGIELCIGPGDVVNGDLTAQQCDEIRQAVDAAGLVAETVASGMSWATNPTSDDADTRQKAIDLHADALRRTGDLGCQAMLMVPGVVGGPIGDEVVRYDRALDRAEQAVEALLPVAEQAEVDLCLENVWNGLFYSPVEFAAFVDRFGSERLGVYFDAGNLIGIHQHPPHWIELLGERIKRVHIKDFRSDFGAGQFGFCDLLEGQVPWPQTMRALRQIGYDRTVVAEMMPYRDDLLLKTRQAMDEIFEMT